MPATEYLTGHVKRNPETGMIAIRTIFPETDDQFRAMAWLIATPNIGARNGSTADVDSWDDLYTPPVPEVPVG